LGQGFPEPSAKAEATLTKVRVIVRAIEATMERKRRTDMLGLLSQRMASTTYSRALP